jgi:hypothetical protein
MGLEDHWDLADLMDHWGLMDHWDLMDLVDL